MRILGLPKLEEFKRNHADVRRPLDAWRLEVERASWQTTQDIKQSYRSADFLADNRVIFNIKGITYRLVVQVRYQNGLVIVEWIGLGTSWVTMGQLQSVPLVVVGLWLLALARRAPTLPLAAVATTA